MPRPAKSEGIWIHTRPQARTPLYLTFALMLFGFSSTSNSARISFP